MTVLHIKNRLIPRLRRNMKIFETGKNTKVKPAVKSSKVGNRTGFYSRIVGFEHEVVDPGGVTYPITSHTVTVPASTVEAGDHFRIYAAFDASGPNCEAALACYVYNDTESTSDSIIFEGGNPWWASGTLAFATGNLAYFDVDIWLHDEQGVMFKGLIVSDEATGPIVAVMTGLLNSLTTNLIARDTYYVFELSIEDNNGNDNIEGHMLTVELIKK